MGGPNFLLAPEVQKELNLTQDQIAAIQKLFPPRRGNGGGPGGPPPGRGPGGEGGPPPGQGGQGGPPPQGGSGRQNPIEEKLAQILSADQMARFKQLNLQAQGPMIIGRPDIADKLELSQDQKDQIHQIMDAAQQNRPRPDGGQPQNMRQQMKVWRDQTGQKVLGVLTGAQRRAWEGMLGKPFKFPEPPQRPGGE
jgi:hypothetical protein